MVAPQEGGLIVLGRETRPEALRLEASRARRSLERRHRRYPAPADRPDPTREAGTDLLPQIRHIVVLMMENHSYDNYLGTLTDGAGQPRGDGFTLVKGVPTNSNRALDGTPSAGKHAAGTKQT